MKYASVIVDVPTMQTDRTFDYKIPEKWQGMILQGMRVIVPFGQRKLQGFVIEVKEESSFKKLKSIEGLQDLTPSVTPELLQLGSWLTETTLCFNISALQAMLPAAMKAKYDKMITLISEEKRKELEPTLKKYFEKQAEIPWSTFEDDDLLKQIQKEIQKGSLEVVYRVSQKTKQKKKRVVQLAQIQTDRNSPLDLLPSQAKKQKEMAQFAVEHIGSKEMPASDFLSLTNGSESSLKGLIQKGIITEKWVEIYRDPYEGRHFKKSLPLPLTTEQQQSISPILESVENKLHKVFLMYGVTGSGKTEVYLQSIEAVLNKGKEAIVLVPEISLTPQMVNRFKSRFGSMVAVLHSGLSIGEKYDEWRKIQRKEVKLVVGARSAIFAPFENLGMIIIDEEHETSYKQEETPRYHARDVAIKRGDYHNCPVVLGSATPTLESFARAQKGVYTLLTLKERVNNRAMPAVEIIDMREELRNGNRSMFSETLLEALQSRIEKKEQTVLFLNKRGYSSFVMCRDCGYVIQCPHCDISLTYHRFGQQLKCHYCGHEEIMPKVCPECQSEHIRYFGTGTQKVEEELAKVLPEASVIRMDVDTTSKKGSHERLLTKFGEGGADILLGTQMIAKGLDFPKVTLVGVLSADTMLHLPDFRAAEKTFQLLTQVSGRAGRHELPGEVIIQSYTPEHYSIELTKEHHYDEFFRQELAVRKLHEYPPYYYICLLTISHPDVLKVAIVTENISTFLKSNLSQQSIILGPVTSPIPKIKDRYRYQCMIKYKKEKNLHGTLKNILEHYQKDVHQNSLQITIDMNPYVML
ncbi:primosomal protein N' [Metabacillus arenae]|uniref:Replication restart protein PriA n=1 Tax=Metabacillus arenae TaxID=2771434 RepID=A0A926NGC2_9BACI|nr:primosomal protein N' [Metabacillus arenae]MBD1379993.1 primosomal protein N' [Metabacillus arenae]